MEENTVNTYYIYRIEKNGTPKKKQTTHAHSLENAWNSNKSWYIEGLFLVTNADGSEAKIFTLYQHSTTTKEQNAVINTYTRNGILYIYYGDSLLAEIEDGEQTEEFIEDVLFGMGYTWHTDGSITKREDAQP